MSAELYRETVEVAGVKRVARALGLSDRMVYLLARDPMDPEHPDQTGAARNDLDRLVTLLEVVSTLPSARPLLHKWRAFFEQLFDRLIYRQEPGPCSHDRVVELASIAIKEHGEAMGEAITKGGYSVARGELHQAMESLRCLDSALAVMEAEENVRPINRRAS